MAEEETQECPICGVDVGEEATECPECGEPLTEDEDKEKAVERLTEISGLGKNRAEKLYEEGFKSPRDILEGGMKGLAGIEQVGVRTARKIIDEAEKLIEEKDLFKEEPEEEKIEEHEEEVEEEAEEEFPESMTEDLRTVIEEEEELEEIPKRVIVGEEILENFRDFVPIISGFLIPFFLLIFVASEFVAVMLDYTSIYPAQTFYYLTPLHYLGTSWIVSLTLSLVIVVAIFLTTWKAYDFNSARRLRIDKNMIFYSAVLSFIIFVSLMMHTYYSHPYPGKGLTFVFLILALFLFVVHLELLRKKETIFPRIEEKKACVKCKGLIDLDLETCPRCSSKVGILKEGVTKVEEEGVWYSISSSLQNKLRRKPKVSKDEAFSEEEWKPEVPGSEEELEEEEVPPWKEEPEEEAPPWEEEEEPEEEAPPWEEEEEPEEEAPPWEEELEEEEVEEELEEEKEGGALKRLSGMASSIRDGLSSTASLLKGKLQREPKTTPEEEAPEELEEEEIEEEGVCPTCGAIIPIDAENCPECGEELEPPEEELEEEEIETETALDDLEKALEEVEDETEAVVFVCPICDAELEEDVDECPECGTVFVEEEEEEE